MKRLYYIPYNKNHCRLNLKKCSPNIFQNIIIETAFIVIENSDFQNIFPTLLHTNQEETIIIYAHKTVKNNTLNKLNICYFRYLRTGLPY